MTQLTSDQKTVADAVLRKLFEGKPQEIIISGPAGTGKSFLIKYILNDIIKKYSQTQKILGLEPRFMQDVLVSATTNKAVKVLEESISYPVATIESYLHLVVTGDNFEGQYKLAPSKFGLASICDSLIIIDEASMISYDLYKYIQKCCMGCFIIYVGDDCQLPAVRSGSIPLIWQKGFPEFKLTSLVRQADNQEIADLCTELRKTVQNQKFFGIQTAKSIRQITDPEEQKLFLMKYDFSFGKIITYTNSKSIQYNEWIMSQNHVWDKSPFYVNETYVVNDYYKNPYLNISIPAETKVRVVNIYDKLDMDYKGATCSIYKLRVKPLLQNSNVYADVDVPEDRDFFKKWLKYIAKYKDWNNYFFWKQSCLDLRGNYACTIHKAQGSTFDNVIIDASDFKSCTNPMIAARLLYVAVSRAKHGITFFGQLPKRYGEILCQSQKKETALPSGRAW